MDCGLGCSEKSDNLADLSNLANESCLNKITFRYKKVNKTTKKTRFSKIEDFEEGSANSSRKNSRYSVTNCNDNQATGDSSLDYSEVHQMEINPSNSKANREKKTIFKVDDPSSHHDNCKIKKHRSPKKYINEMDKIKIESLYPDHDKTSEGIEITNEDFRDRLEVHQIEVSPCKRKVKHKKNKISNEDDASNHLHNDKTAKKHKSPQKYVFDTDVDNIQSEQLYPHHDKTSEGIDMASEDLFRDHLEVHQMEVISSERKAKLKRKNISNEDDANNSLHNNEIAKKHKSPHKCINDTDNIQSEQLYLDHDNTSEGIEITSEELFRDKRKAKLKKIFNEDSVKNHPNGKTTKKHKRSNDTDNTQIEQLNPDCNKTYEGIEIISEEPYNSQIMKHKVICIEGIDLFSRESPQSSNIYNKGKENSIKVGKKKKAKKNKLELTGGGEFHASRNQTNLQEKDVDCQETFDSSFIKDKKKQKLKRKHSSDTQTDHLHCEDNIVLKETAAENNSCDFSTVKCRKKKRSNGQDLNVSQTETLLCPQATVKIIKSETVVENLHDSSALKNNRDSLEKNKNKVKKKKHSKTHKSKHSQNIHKPPKNNIDHLRNQLLKKALKNLKDQKTSSKTPIKSVTKKHSRSKLSPLSIKKSKSVTMVQKPLIKNSATKNKITGELDIQKIQQSLINAAMKSLSHGSGPHKVKTASINKEIDIQSNKKIKKLKNKEEKTDVLESSKAKTTQHKKKKKSKKKDLLEEMTSKLLTAALANKQ